MGEGRMNKMVWKPTKAQRANMTPGVCTRCGQYTEYDRNSAGECWQCHNKSAEEYRDARKLQLDAIKEQGRKFWESQGIRVGDKVERLVVSIFGISAHMVRGIAKVGVVGAYVSSNFQPGYLTCRGWRKVSA